MTYYEFYKLCHGLYITYHNSFDKPVLTTRHKRDKMDEMKYIVPYEKFKNKHRKTIILSGIYVIFNKSPASFNKFLQDLRELDFDEIKKFKYDIKMHETYIKKDIKLLKEKLITTKEEAIQLFLKNEIKFYSLYFYLKAKNEFEALKNSRIYKTLYKRLKFIMLFLNFDKENIIKSFEKL